MVITCWGARGSIPVSGMRYVRYGGDTPCMEVRTTDGGVIIVDAGSGIRRAGNRLIEEKRTSFHLIFTHAHWDHILGFPFLKPIYRSDNRIDIYGCAGADMTMLDTLAKSMAAPYFPVPYDSIAAEMHYHGACDESLTIGSVDISTISLSHPNGGIGLRFSENGSSFVFLTDNELTYRHPGGLDPEAYRRFSEGADILIHDAEFTAEEYRSTRTWGHSVYTDALDLAIDAGVRRFGLYHHNQGRTDEALYVILDDCRRIAAGRGSELDIFAAAQDMELVV